MTTSHDQSRAQWRKSTRSGYANCVEVASIDANIGIRDSKAPDTAHLTLKIGRAHV